MLRKSVNSLPSTQKPAYPSWLGTLAFCLQYSLLHLVQFFIHTQKLMISFKIRMHLNSVYYVLLCFLELNFNLMYLPMIIAKKSITK